MPFEEPRVWPEHLSYDTKCRVRLDDVVVQMAAETGLPVGHTALRAYLNLCSEAAPVPFQSHPNSNPTEVTTTDLEFHFPPGPKKNEQIISLHPDNADVLLSAFARVVQIYPDPHIAHIVRSVRHNSATESGIDIFLLISAVQRWWDLLINDYQNEVQGYHIDSAIRLLEILLKLSPSDGASVLSSDLRGSVSRMLHVLQKTQVDLDQQKREAHCVISEPCNDAGSYRVPIIGGSVTKPRALQGLLRGDDQLHLARAMEDAASLGLAIAYAFSTAEKDESHGAHAAADSVFPAHTDAIFPSICLRSPLYSPRGLPEHRFLPEEIYARRDYFNDGTVTEAAMPLIAAFQSAGIISAEQDSRSSLSTLRFWAWNPRHHPDDVADVLDRALSVPADLREMLRTSFCACCSSPIELWGGKFELNADRPAALFVAGNGEGKSVVLDAVLDCLNRHASGRNILAGEGSSIGGVRRVFHNLHGLPQGSRLQHVAALLAEFLSTEGRGSILLGDEIGQETRTEWGLSVFLTLLERILSQRDRLLAIATHLPGGGALAQRFREGERIEKFDAAAEAQSLIHVVSRSGTDMFMAAGFRSDHSTRRGEGHAIPTLKAGGLDDTFIQRVRELHSILAAS